MSKELSAARWAYLKALPPHTERLITEARPRIDGPKKPKHRFRACRLKDEQREPAPGNGFHYDRGRLVPNARGHR